MSLEQLDLKLWMALACPVTGLELDELTLKLLDPDQDGTIRAEDVMQAFRWAGTRLKSPESLLDPAEALPFSALDTSHKGGQALLAAAELLAESLENSEARSLTVEEASQGVRAFELSAFNGDGVLPPQSGRFLAEQTALEDVLLCMGGLPDRSGLDGVDRKRIEAFFEALAERREWYLTGDDLRVGHPLGEALEVAHAVYAPLEVKIDDYFERCRTVAYDARATASLRGQVEAYEDFADEPMNPGDPRMRALPLAFVEAGRPLPLSRGGNPAWRVEMAAFLKDCVTPMLAEQRELTEDQWLEIRMSLAHYRVWHERGAGSPVALLARERVEELAASGIRANLLEAMDSDERAAEIAQGFDDVARLARYHRDLYTLARNFVSFVDFYDGGTPAIFQAGTLFLDERACELCLSVDDIDKHAAMAGLAGVYLVYCACVRGTKKRTVVAAMTNGHAVNLMVGRHGVFYDRRGRDWTATVVRIVDHPISMTQAFWSPYRKAGRFLEEQILARAKAAQADGEKRLSTVSLTDIAGGKPAADGKKSGFDIGVLAALGVAVSGLTAGLGALLQAFFGLGMWMPLGFLGVLLIISGPSVMMAWMKLRRRSLGPILDASGWAVNSQARLSVAFGRELTKVAVLPDGAPVEDLEPATGHGRWWVLAGVLLLAGVWWNGRLNRWLNPRFQRRVRVEAPMAAPVQPPKPSLKPAAPGS